VGWQKNDRVLAELRAAQAELESMHRGLTLLTLDQRLYVLPSIEDLERKIRYLQDQLE